MSTTDRASTSTQTSDRPTRAAVVLTLAMMVVPLLTLLISAAGCSRSIRSGSLEVGASEHGHVESITESGETTAKRSQE